MRETESDNSCKWRKGKKGREGSEAEFNSNPSQAFPSPHLNFNQAKPVGLLCTQYTLSTVYTEYSTCDASKSINISILLLFSSSKHPLINIDRFLLFLPKKISSAWETYHLQSISYIMRRFAVDTQFQRTYVSMYIRTQYRACTYEVKS